MKKIIFILIAICFFSSNTYADHKGWPHGKKWAYNCAKTTECNIIIENINSIWPTALTSAAVAKAKAKNHPAVAPLPQIPAGKDFFQNWKRSKIYCSPMLQHVKYKNRRNFKKVERPK